MIKVTLVCLLIVQSMSQTDTSYYDIPAYYGHFSLEYFQPSNILNGKLTRVEYHFAVDANYQNTTIYYASQIDHCVYSYDVNTAQISLLAGICGQAGNILGSVETAEFNGVSSLAYFQHPSQSLLQQLNAQSVSIASNQWCELNSANCKMSAPYQNLSMSNIRISPFTSLYVDEGNSDEYLYLADTGNHCIKRLSFLFQQVQVVAGKCGQSGFLDGPFGYNRLNSPRNIGVSRFGVVYFFDYGNEYIRLVNADGSVSTLKLGACKQFLDYRTIQGYNITQILCYEDWIERMTQSSVNHYFEPSLLNVCTNQSSSC